MRLRFWPLWLLYDERIADLRTKLRAAQQHAVRLKFGNQRLAAENVKLTRANLQLSARVSELEQTVVAMAAESGLDDAWDDVAAVQDGRPG